MAWHVHVCLHGQCGQMFGLKGAPHDFKGLNLGSAAVPLCVYSAGENMSLYCILEVPS